MSALPAYALFALLALIVPGVALQRLARVRVDPALALPLGLAACAGAYALSVASGQRWLFGALPLAALGLLGAAARGLWPMRRDDSTPGPGLRGAVLPALLLVGLLALTQYGENRLDASGAFRFDPLLTYDATFHVGVTRELSLGLPPQVPGLAGFRLGYHLGLDLVRAAALDWAGIDPFDALSRFDVTLSALALLLALRAAAQRGGLGAGAVALVPYTLLLTDGSWLFAANPQAHWWSDLLRGNLLLSLALANPALPALSLALGALVALSRAAEAGPARPGHLFLAAVQAAAVPHFKVFLGAHLLFGLGAWFALRRAARRDVALVAAPCLLATAALVLGQGGESVAVVLDPLELVRATRASLGLEPLAGLPLLGFAAFWVLASLGARVCGLPAAWRALRSGPGAAVALAAMALVGWPLGLVLRVSAPVLLPGEPVINDAAYFIEQSGPVLWLFGAAALADACLSGSRVRRVLAPVALALSLPATAHFAWKKPGLAHDPFPAARLRAVQAAAALTRPGEVILQRPGGRYPPGPVIFASRRVAFERFTPYLTQFAPRAELEQRHADVAQFFRTRDPDEARRLARKLGARVVCLYDGERVRFAPEALMRVVHAEPGARVYVLRE